MRIRLTDDVPNLGFRGDVIDVAQSTGTGMVGHGMCVILDRYCDALPSPPNNVPKKPEIPAVSQRGITAGTKTKPKPTTDRIELLEDVPNLGFRGDVIDVDPSAHIGMAGHGMCTVLARGCDHPPSPPNNIPKPKVLSPVKQRSAKPKPKTETSTPKVNDGFNKR